MTERCRKPRRADAHALKRGGWRRSSKLWLLMALAATLCALGCDASDDRGEVERSSRDAAADGEVERDGEAVDASAPELGGELALLGFSAVWGSSADDVWIVGSQGLILHFDGTAFEVLQSPTTARLTAVYGTGPDDVWIVGDLGAAFRWNGTIFEDHSGEEDETLLGVWASGPEDVWMVGTLTRARSGLVRRVIGTKTVDNLVPGCASLWEVWGSGPNDVWMVGSTPELTGLALRGDGMTFDSVDLSGGPLRGVWGSEGEDVWIIPYDTAAQHWDGSSLKAANEAPSTPQLAAWGSSSSDVWSVGLEGGIWHYDGSAWTATESGTDATIWGVWGSAADDVWAVGNSATLLRWRGREWKRFGAPR